MSGFLSNLVTKSLNPTVVVRPRLLSLFEPTSERAPHRPMAPTLGEHDRAQTPDPHENVAKETTSAPSHATFMPERISPQTRSQDSGTAALAQDWRSPVASQQVAQMAAPGQSEPRPQVAPSEPMPLAAPAQGLHPLVASQQAAQMARQEQHEPHPQAASPAPTPPPGPALIEHTVERVVVERVAALPAQLAAAQYLPPVVPLRSAMQTRRELIGTNSLVTQPETDDNPMQGISQEQISIIPSAPATPLQDARIVERLHITEWASTVPIPVPEPPAPTSSAIVAQPRVTRYVEPLRQAAVTDASPPVPTVQVTIGRIEVRATQQPSQPMRTRPEPARLSLDEYLHQRSRGGGG